MVLVLLQSFNKNKLLSSWFMSNILSIPHLSQQFQHFGCLLRPLLPEMPLDFPDPSHPPHIRAVVGFPQHPWKLVGLEHQGGKQEVPPASAATSLAVCGAVISLASPPGQFTLQIETSLSGQLRAHHSWEDEVVLLRGISQHAAKTSHWTCSEAGRNKRALGNIKFQGCSELESIAGVMRAECPCRPCIRPCIRPCTAAGAPACFPLLRAGAPLSQSHLCTAQSRVGFSFVDPSSTQGCLFDIFRGGSRAFWGQRQKHQGAPRQVTLINECLLFLL